MTSRDRITCSDLSFTTQNRLKKLEKYAIILENERGENYERWRLFYSTRDRQNYADEGITCVMAKKRTNFMRMMRDCEKGKIDLILTKSVARFARNTVDSLNYVRRLKAKGIGVYFEEQALDSLK